MSDTQEKITDPITTADLESTPEEALSSMRQALMGEEEIQETEELIEGEEIEESEELDESEDEVIEESDEDEEIEETEEEYEESEDEDEEDYDEDDDLDLDANPDEDEESEEEFEEEEESKETAVTQLRKLSKIKKELEADNDLLNEQLVSKDQEIDQMRSQLDKMSATKIDPTSHPDFMDLRSKTHNGIATQLRRALGTDTAKVIVGTETDPKWGRILTDVANLDSLPFEEQDTVENDLRLHIAQRLGFQGDELDPEYDGDFIKKADGVISTVGNFTSNYDELASLHKNILDKSQNKSLELGYKDYLEKTKSIREGMAIIETMSDKDIQEDPDSLQSLAARKIQRSPQMKSQFDKIKKSVMEMAYGPEALSQEELDKHVATGKDMDEFHKKRAKRVETFRNERLTEIAAAMLLWPEIKEQMPKYFKTQTDKNRTESKKKILRQSKKKSPLKQKPKESEKSVDEHKSSIASALGM